MRGRHERPLGAPKLEDESVVRSTTSRAPLLQIAGRLDLGGLQRLTVEEDDAFEADAQQTCRPSLRLPVQQFLHLEDLTAKGRQALTSVNVQLL